MTDQRDSADEPPQMPAGRAAVSEEDHTAQSTPVHNLIGALVMGAVALLAMVMSLTMDNPSDGILTAPGLLPFIVGASLFAMSAGLAWTALRRGAPAMIAARLRGADASSDAAGGAGWRTFLLVMLVGLYVEALDLAYFQWTLTVGETRLQWGSFEAWSALFLAVVLRLFWRGAWTRCIAMGLIYATLLAGVFRYGFNIPVPGSG